MRLLFHVEIILVLLMAIFAKMSGVQFLVVLPKSKGHARVAVDSLFYKKVSLFSESGSSCDHDGSHYYSSTCRFACDYSRQHHNVTIVI